MQETSADSTMVQQAHILLVEDNPGDIALMERALRDSKLNIHLSIAYDGGQALAILGQKGGFGDLKAPDIILLDLNLPQMHGHEVLKRIKNDDTVKHIPVIVLSSSSDEGDIEKSYDLQATDYIVKAKSSEELKSIVQKIEEFLLQIG